MWKLFNRKRITIGLICIATAVVLGSCLSFMTGADRPMWQRMTFAVTVLGLGLGGFLHILAGWLGFLEGFGGMLFLALIYVLPGPWNLCAVAVYLALLCALPVILKYHQKKNRRAAMADILAAGGELPSSIVLAIRPANGCIYQLLRGEDGLFVYRVGDNVRGLDPTHLRARGDASSALGKRDLFIPEAEVKKLRFATPENLYYSLCVTLRAGRKTYRFVPFGNSDSALIDLFRDFAVDVQADPDDRLGRGERDTEVPECNSQRAKILRRVLTALMVLAGAAQFAWLFLNVPYSLFAALSLLPTPAVLLLYMLFPSELTVSENRVRAGSRIRISSKLMLPSFVPLMRTMLDFNFLNWARLWIIAGILFLTLMAAVLILTREWRVKPSLLLVCVFALAVYLPGLTGQANVLLDTARPTVSRAEIVEMSVHRNSRAPDRYVFTLDTDDVGEIELNVARSQYEGASIGDSVYVITYPGRLGIPYADVYSEN